MEKNIKKYEKIKLEEMSNLFPESTGLTVKLWISSKSGREKHTARIKATTTEGSYSISIYGEPEIKKIRGKDVLSAFQIKKIKEFIKKNKKALLAHWNAEIDSKTFTQKIKKICKILKKKGPFP